MRLFNFENKEKYLEQFSNEDTKEVYTRLFKKSAEMEEKLEKDIYDFDDKELEYFLSNILKPKTKESARTYCNVLASYIQWGIDKSYSTQIINPIKRRQEYFFEFVQDTKLYFSFEEKQAILRTLVNRQDGFIIEGLWNGIQGVKVSELIGLKVDDVNLSNNSITIRDNNGIVSRILHFSDDETTIVEMAILANREEEYYKRNGEVDYSNNIKDVVELSKSQYVIKSGRTKRNGGKEGGEKASHFTVYNRLEMIRTLEEFEEYADALTTKNIVRSGMIIMALNLYKRDRVLDRSQIEEICSKYNMKYKWSLRDFLNLDMLKLLYPSEMNDIEKEIATE